MLDKFADEKPGAGATTGGAEKAGEIADGGAETAGGKTGGGAESDIPGN